MASQIPPAEPMAGVSEAGSDELSEAAHDPVVVVLDRAIAMGRQRRLMMALPCAAAAIATAVVLLLPKTYTATTRILPPQQAQSAAAAMLAQVGGLVSAAAGSLGLKNPNDLFIAMLRSDTVADAMIARFGLMEAYRAKHPEEARRRLWDHSRFASEKSGIISIDVEATSPARAAEMANAYVEELHRITTNLAITEAAQRRVFFERQLDDAKQKLAQSELDLRRGIDAGGLVSVDAQSRATVETVARLRAQISAKQVEIGATRSYAVAGSPDLRRPEEELSALKGELARLESGMPSANAPTSPAAAGRGSTGGLATLRLVRDVKYNESLLEFLAKQYEIARIDESREAPIVQVLDKARPPERSSGPRSVVIVVGSAFGAFIAAVAYALGQQVLETARRDPARRRRLAALRSTWTGKAA